jgi:CheY-like chemotaxis protein
METRHKILLLDDDPELLTTYQQILGGLPSRPEIRTASSGPRAMAMLEAEEFRLLICDLRMPKMDGLQVLSIVRRKHPELRTVALTGIADEQFRSRAYALGVDQFWYKPGSEQEIKMFMECLESLLGQESETGFRGVQSKSLVDIIQLECISQSSSVLRITNGQLAGRIWIQDGEIIDAEAAGLNAEPAFQKILSWKNGAFESLPAEPNHQRQIFKSYNAILLETAQVIDESQDAATANGHTAADLTPLAQLSQVDGVEFVLAMKPGDNGSQVGRGLENPEHMAAWAKQSLQRFRALSDRWHAGPLEQIECLGPQRHVALATQGETEFCVGWKYTMTAGQIREMMKKVLALWAS